MVMSRRYLSTLLLIVGCCLTALAAEGVSVRAQPALDYNLLFVKITYTGEAWEETLFESALYYLDTATWTTTALDVSDRPISVNALSPDGQRLAVVRDTQLCLVDAHWQTLFCLPEDIVTFDEWRPLGVTYTLTNRFHIYWEPDSQSFWMPSQDDACPTLLQISADDGVILRAVPIDREVCYQTNAGHCVHDLSPASRIALLTPCDSTRVTAVNFETGQRLSSRLDTMISLSPEGQRLAVPAGPFTYQGTVRMGYIYDLSEPDVFVTFATEASWLTPITPEPDWSQMPEFEWLDAEADRRGVYQFFWSHDGQRLAFRRHLRESDEPHQPLAATYIYDIDTEAIHPLTRGGDPYMTYESLNWSPDDAFIARVLQRPPYSGRRITFTEDFSIVTVDGEVYPIAQYMPDGEESYFEIRAVTWVPRGWLQLDDLASE